jgi:hypothetical protein
LLDLGFQKELTRISRALKNEKQSVLCSATFPDGVQRLAADFLDPKYYVVSVGVVGSTHSKIRQRFEWMELPHQNDFLDPKYYFVSVGVVGSTHSKIRQRFEWMELPHRTVNYERNAENPRVDAVIRNVEQFWDKADRKKDQSSVIVFSNTKDGVEEYGKALSQKFGGTKIRVIHGDKEQSERNRAIGKRLDVLRVHCGHILSLMNLLDGPTPPEEKNGPQKSKAPRGRDPRAPRNKKTLELANDGLGKDETKTQKLRESASPNLKKARIERSARSSLPLALSSLLPSSAFVPHSQLYPARFSTV